MLTYALALGLVLIAIGFAVLALTDGEVSVPFFVIGVLLTFFFGISNLVAAYDYVNSKAYVAQADELIAVRQEELAKLDGQLEQAQKVEPTALLNADAPVAAIVAARLRVSAQLMQIRERKIEREIDMRAQEMGLHGPFVRTFFQ